MFETKNDPLAPISAFAYRVIKSFLLAFMVILVGLAIGIVGYRYFENMTWVDAFSNAAMILSDMGPQVQLQSAGGKIFAGVYALFSGLIFVSVMSIILAPIVHRFLHFFHNGQNESNG